MNLTETVNKVADKKDSVSRLQNQISLVELICSVSRFIHSYICIIFFSGTKVVLFCVRADFNGDEVCLSFGGDNGVRTILLNGSIQYPLVQVRLKVTSMEDRRSLVK